MIKAYFIYLTLLFTINVYAVDNIHRTVYHVVDTTQCQIKQARSVYAWITNNICYDTRQLKKGLKNYTAEQVISQRKAVCYGYSILFHEMCSALDIQSFIILGYSKGFGYVKGNHFTKSNHAWNIIYADSTWIIVDPTWGSGSLSYTYDLKTRIKRVVNTNSGIKSKIVFIKEPNDTYFNIAPNKICSTHLPIDAKWQLSENAVTYDAFIYDSISNTMFLNYHREIKKVLLQDISEQVFIDALNSVNYNPHNNFDIANQYFNRAQKIQVTRKTPLDSLLLKQLSASINYYDSCLSYLKLYKAIRRPIYKTKRKSNKSDYKQANRALKQIRKIPSDFNDRYIRAISKIFKNESVLNKARSKTYSALYNLPTDINYAFETDSIADSAMYKQYLNKLEIDTIKTNNLLNELYAINQEIKKLSQTDSNNNILIFTTLTGISNELVASKNAIENIDEFKYIQSCRNISQIHNDYASILKNKNQIDNNINLRLLEFDTKSQRTESILYSLTRTCEKIAVLSGNNKPLTQKTLELIKKINNLYLLKIETLAVLKEHNDNWLKLLSKQNTMLSKFGKKGLPNISAQITDFYNYIATKNERSYINDMKVYNTIKDFSKSGKTTNKTVSRKINAAYKQKASE